jgi:hypothetical protein
MSIGQIYDMSNTTINTCGGTFYDQGGSSGDYINNQFLVMTFCSSTPGDQIQFNFSAFSTQLNEDYLYIYNGQIHLHPFWVNIQEPTVRE